MSGGYDVYGNWYDKRSDAIQADREVWWEHEEQRLEEERQTEDALLREYEEEQYEGLLNNKNKTAL